MQLILYFFYDSDSIIFEEDTNFGRNPQEIANEVERFIGDCDEDNSWTKKHIKRHEWVKTNINVLISEYELKDGVCEVYSLFAISNEIPATYVRSMPLPFISYSRLVREGLNALDEVLLTHET